MEVARDLASYLWPGRGIAPGMKMSFCPLNLSLLSPSLSDREGVIEGRATGETG